MNIYELGRKLAEEFAERKQDVFVETVMVNGEEVTVSVKYAPKDTPITNNDVWKMLLAQR